LLITRLEKKIPSENSDDVDYENNKEHPQLDEIVDELEVIYFVILIGNALKPS